MNNWTEKQLDVIQTRDKNILVSAAAGSGKTAVLVERIIKMVTDRKNPVDIDKLLVVTFTKAAASEMKERVREALEKIADNEPENMHIQKQLSFIHNANICTIDSFCAGIVRENFNKIDIDPDFRIADEGEINLLKNDIINEMLEQYYEEAAPEFMKLVEQYTNKKTADSLGDLISELYNAASSHEKPVNWIKECNKTYKITSVDELNNSQWINALIQRERTITAGLIENAKIAVRICNNEDGPYINSEIMSNILSDLEVLYSEYTYSDIREYLQTMKIPSLSRKKCECSKSKKKAVSEIKAAIAAQIKELRSTYFLLKEEEILNEIIFAADSVEMIIKLTLDFYERFSRQKAEKAIMDFSDQEHYALDILTEEVVDDTKEGGIKLVPSQVAKELSLSYIEIMIDEYQDSNYVQEAILTSVSRDKKNIFMVGDIKQSIYRFRLANPNLFLEKYDTYSTEKNAEDYKIILDKNFRSRREIVDSVNFIFNYIMQKDAGGIDYKNGNQLVYGADYRDLPEGQDNSTEFIMIEGSVEQEAEYIAMKVKELTNEKAGIKVQNKDGSYRIAKYSDIVILLRAVAGKAEVYVNAMESLDIPAYAETKTGYYNTAEVQTMLSILSVIDNPLQDIPIIAVLSSSLFNFTPDELAEIKIMNSCEYLYDSLKEYINNGQDEAIVKKVIEFTKVLEGYRKIVPYNSVYDLMEKIINETGFERYFAALPAGNRRVKNIEILKEKAALYDSTSYKGLFNFLRYIEKIKQLNQDEGEAASVNENDNIVRVMSIHKSKGLQFPIVFVANTAGKSRNNTDMLSIHEKYGVGVDYINSELKVKYPTKIKEFINSVIDEEEKSEKLRLLYVALTRAQEKLFVTGSGISIKSLVKKFISAKYDYSETMMYSDIMKAGNFMAWMGIPIGKNKAFTPIDKIMEVEPEVSNPMYFVDSKITSDYIYGEEISDNFLEELQKVMDNLGGMNNCNDNKQKKSINMDNIMANLMWKYKFAEDVKLYSKASVTELKRESMYEEEQDGKLIYETSVVEKSELPEIVPQFAKEDAELSMVLTGAGRGTAYHRVFELIDMNLSEYTQASVNEMMNELLDKGLIDELTLKTVSISDIIKFTKTKLFARMKKAEKNGNLFREKQFLMGIPAKEVSNKSDASSNEMVIVQGIIDVCFIEDGKYVIADYKTDNIDQLNELVHKYDVQLKYYQKAIEKIAEIPVTERILYSVKLGDEISL